LTLTEEIVELRKENDADGYWNEFFWLGAIIKDNKKPGLCRVFLNKAKN
jgi:hypothetical protein